jgi:D-sedoheptulose 7-phosphate isomerase
MINQGKQAVVPEDSTAVGATILRKVQESANTSLAFFDGNMEVIERLAAAMAERFANGGRLFVMGNGGSSCDAEHVAVEFMHPIFEKRKPLPCQSLSAGSALLSAISNDADFSRVYGAQLVHLARPEDMALAISTSGQSANLIHALQEAKRIGLMTIAFAGKDGGRLKDVADWCLVVPSYSIHRIQETHVVLLHILWDSIHIVMGEEDIV